MIEQERTVLIVTPYFPPEGGGTARYAFEIATRLQREHGWRIVFLTTGERYGGEEKITTTEGFTLYKLGYKYRLSNTPLSFGWPKQIKRILKAENPDIINVHTPVPGIGDITTIVAGKTPVIVTYHAGSMHKNRFLYDIFIWIYEHGFMHRLLRRADRIICSSDFVRFNFLKSYVYKSDVITPATNTDVFKPDATKKALHPTILFVAGLKRSEQYKGLKKLLDAVSVLKKTIPDLQLTVVGDGGMRPEYESYAAKLGLQDSVRFTGRLGGNALVEEYQRAHLFVHPSSNDSFPTVLIEAMACGLPVVSTLVGGIPELVENGKTGFLIEADDEKALVGRISEILLNPELSQNFSKNALQRIVNAFNWETRAERYSTLYISLLKKFLGKNEIAVTHVVPYYPPHLGGMEQRVKDLAVRQAQNGLDVSVLTSNLKTPTGDQLCDGVAVSYLPSIEIFHTPLTPGLIWRLLTLQKTNLIHLHVVLAYFPEVTAFFARLRGIPYIAHPRALIMPAEVRKYYPWLLATLSILHDRLLGGYIMRGASAVIALTPDYKEIIHDRYRVPLDKIIIIPNATNFPVDATSRTAPHGPFRLLAVGRIAVQKNYQLLIKMAGLLKHTHHLDFELTIVGTGDGNAELDAEIRRLDLESTIHFVGKKLGKDLEKMYEDADILVHGSLFEGFSTVFLEAMAKGVPIVATDVVGTRSVVKHEHNGLLAQLTPTSMSDAVLRLIADPALYERISKNNIEEVQQYKWENILKTTTGVYRDVLHIQDVSELYGK